MNIVVCVKYVPDAQPSARSALRQHRPTATVWTGCCPSSTSTPSRRRSRSSRPRRGRGHRRDGRSRPPPPTPSRRPSRWAPTRACTSTTTRSTAPTPWPPRSCSPRRSRSSGGRPRHHRHGLDRRARWVSSRRCWPSGSACRRSPSPPSSTVDGRTVTIRRDGDDAITRRSRRALPAVVSVTDQTNEPRYPSFKGIMAAKKKPVETWGSPTSASTPPRSASTPRGPRSSTSAEAPPAGEGPDRPDEGEGRMKLAEFLAGQT